MQLEIEEKFDGWIKAKFKENSEVLNFLLKHERKQVCITRLSEQIRLAELSNIRGRFNSEKYHWLIADVAAFFCDRALEYAREKAVSEAERQRRTSESLRLKEAESMLHELEKEALDEKPRIFVPAAAADV